MMVMLAGICAKTSRAATLLSLLLLSGCQLQALLEHTAPGPARLPAASYYAWASQAPDSELQAELQRLDNSADPDLIAIVQRAIVLYHQDEEQATIGEINFEHPRMPVCRQGRLCEDYVAFARLIRELSVLRDRAQSSQDEARALRDQIRALNQQIEALTNIEQQLLERDQRSN